MKLFTTSTALTRLGPESRIPTRVFSDGQLDSKGVLHGSLYLQGGGDPALGTPAFYDAILGGLGTNLFALKPQIRAAGIRAVTGRLYADDTIFDRLRGVADSGYATSPYIGPLSGPRLRLRLRRLQRRRLRLRPGQARRLEAGRGRCAAPGIGITPKVALGATPPGSDADRHRALADPDPDRQHDRRLLRQLLRRDADQAARRALRRRGQHRRRGSRGRALRAPASAPACTPSTAPA